MKRENDVVIYLINEIGHLKTKHEIYDYVKNRLRDALGEVEILIDLNNVKWGGGHFIKIPINFKNESDKNSYKEIEKYYEDIFLKSVTGKIPPIENPPTEFVKNSELHRDYTNLRKIIPTRESMEKQAFIDSLKYIKDYSLKKIKSLIKF